MKWQHIPIKAWKDNPRPILLALVAITATPLLIVCNAVHQPFFALMVSLSNLALIGFGNWDLLKYLKVIAGKPDTTGLIPKAIFQSAILFFAVINLYGALFCSQMAWSLVPTTPVLSIALDYRIASEWVHWFYFSAVTITTLGYGDIAPVSIVSRLTAAFECLNGLIAFGVFTGSVTTYLSRD